MKNPTSLRITLKNAAVTIETDKVNCGFRIDRAWLGCCRRQTHPCTCIWKESREKLR